MMKGRWWPLVAVLAVATCTLLFYRAVLFPANELAKYPWSSDAWGHLIKAEFLREELSHGNLYPNVFPDWYAGVQLFRYYAPLPYYLLVAVMAVTQDTFLAASWYIALCALLGSLSILLYSRWIGPFPATMGALIFLMLPDNVRVSFAEGNLPRVLATALLPATLYFAIRVMDPKDGRRIHIVPLALLISLIVLSHAMMGAITLASLALFCTLYWLLGGSFSTGIVRAAFGLGCGLLLSGWWLMPSLTGGITELNQAAVTEALAHFPLSVSFNPLLRERDLEIFYLGLGLGIGTLVAFLSWGKLPPLAKALILAGTITTSITTTFVNPLFNSLPMHHLFWPIRFSSFASFALLLGIMSSWAPLRRGARWQRLAALLLVLILTVDSADSSSLVHLRIADRTIVAASQKVHELAGWRAATADLSRLGSSPSYWLTQMGGREQVYGWGYQGARIATNVSSVNYAMDYGYFDYAVDRLEELGVDDLILLKGAMRTDGLDQRLEQAGFQPIPLDNRLTLFHKDGAPRAFEVSYDVLGIGSGAQNLALLFPKVTLGYSPDVDDYDLNDLRKYRALFLSRFSWKDKNAAEALIRDYAQGGGTVLVDLTGSPADVLSREPKFLGVYGEPIELVGSVVLHRNGESTRLQPFVFDGDFWQAHIPQGLNKEVITADYLMQKAVALGYNQYGDGRVWFTGLNLPYHALLTRDPVAIGILAEVLGIRAGELPARQTVPVEQYRATADGYVFSYSSDRMREILLPVAAHEGVEVLLDGNVVWSSIVDNLVSMQSPSGQHEVKVVFKRTKIYDIGEVSTALSIALLLGYLLALEPMVAILRRRAAYEGANPAEAH